MSMAMKVTYVLRFNGMGWTKIHDLPIKESKACEAPVGEVGIVPEDSALLRAADCFNQG